MKFKGEFMMRQIGKIWAVLPMGQMTLDLNGMLTLNESGAVLWRALEQGGGREEMIRALTEEYDVSQDRAEADVDRFVDKLTAAGVLEA